ncbi:MAG TPA: hypothetical protein HPQ00_00850 [Magnetococcales bacterium]|nr:hypothetical protein [Magnetococcales bacterium]
MTDEITKFSQRGPVTARVTLAPAKPRLGDAITLTLEVEGEKGIEVLMPEFGQSLGRFAIVDFVPGEKTGEGGKTVARQRYTLQPPMSGEQHIPSLIIGFIDRRPGNRPAPEGEDAYELLTERLTFAVASVIPKGVEADLKPPMGSLAPLARWEGEGQGWWWLLLLLLLVVAGVAGWMFWRGRRTGSVRKSPFEIASIRLQLLKKEPRPTPEEMDAFFVQLSDIVRHYLEARFHIRAPEKTTEEFFDAAAGSPDLTAEHRGFLFRFLEFSDQVKFARHQPTLEHVDQALAAAENFLRQTGQEEPAHG